MSPSKACLNTWSSASTVPIEDDKRKPLPVIPAKAGIQIGGSAEHRQNYLEAVLVLNDVNMIYANHHPSFPRTRESTDSSLAFAVRTIWRQR